MTTKKGISIVVSVYRKKINVPQYINSIRRALLDLDRMQDAAYQFEIIFITNEPNTASIENVEIFPYKVPVKAIVVKKQLDRAALFTKGVANAAYEIIAAIDSDVQFPDKSLSAIIKEISEGTDVVAAFPTKQSKKEHDQKSAFSDVNTRFLFDLQKDPQAGALIFKREVLETLKGTKFLNKTFATEFLHKAREAGFNLTRYDIPETTQGFIPFITNFWKTINAGIFLLLVKGKKVKPILMQPEDSLTMLNAGYRYKKQQFITHSTLDYRISAIDSFTVNQILTIGILLELALIGLRYNVILLGQLIVAFLSFLYLIDVFFNSYLLYRSIKGSNEITFKKGEIEQLNDSNLPVYTILCPLYKEAHMLAPFIEGIEKLDWPKDKLDVMLLLEEDDTESIEKIGQMQLPEYVRAVVVPNSQPKTKPKACNYGLAFAKGEYVVIYDAEDIPDPLQLKKAYIGFQKSDRKVVCLQAKLNYHNTNQNLLTRFFTAEYSWLFDVALPGLQSLNSIIPLGGTSNHFRKEDLETLNGWDPFNVTEDCDLGIRIFKLGYQTAIIDSVTLEEANSQVKNWIRQRSRWVKGYMQTYLVHTRELVSLIKARGIQAFMLHLVIGGRILFIFVNPLLWIVTISYFILHGAFGAAIEQIYPWAILYIAVISLVLGNYLYILAYIMGCIKREQWGLIKFVYLLPMYLVLISVAGCIAFYQLIFKPYYWEKTVHGLHLTKKEKKDFKVKLPDISPIPDIVGKYPSLDDLAA